MSVAGNSYDDYVSDGNKVVHLALIREVEDIDKERYVFNPSFCHQIFGPKETIYGYKNLEIKLFFSAGFLNPYLGIKFTDEVPSKKTNAAKADNIEKILTEKLEITFNRNLDEFVRKLTDEPRFRPMGTLKHTFKVAAPDGDKTYLIYQGDNSVKGLVPFHERLQTFILWFIDAASAIDTDDDRWRFFYIFEKFTASSGEEQYGIVGFATVYEYWVYPEHRRPRISQMMVFPPFQHQGIGTELLRTIIAHYQGDAAVKDITVEDPSDEMQSVRDFVDCQNLLELPELKGESLLTPDKVFDAGRKLKINKKQSRRLYEILRLMRVSRNDRDEYKKYRLEVKSRLNAPHKIEIAKVKQLAKFTTAEVAEIDASMSLSEGARIANLETTFKTLEEQYDRIISRLKAV